MQRPWLDESNTQQCGQIEWVSGASFACFFTRAFGTNRWLSHVVSSVNLCRVMIAAGLWLGRPCDSDLFAEVSPWWSEVMLRSAGSPQPLGYDPATGPEPKPWIPPFHRCAEKEWLVCLPYSEDKHKTNMLLDLSVRRWNEKIKEASKIFQRHTAWFCFSMSQHQIYRFFSQLFPISLLTLKHGYITSHRRWPPVHGAASAAARRATPHATHRGARHGRRGWRCDGRTGSQSSTRVL